MPLKSGRLTPRENVFADAMAATGDKEYAAWKAGYSSPAQSASKALANPAIDADIRRRQLARMNNHLIVLALDVLEDVMTDKKASERGRIAAAKIVSDRVFGSSDPGETKELHELDAGEIQKRLEALRREAADRARVVIEHEPTKPSAFD